MVIIGYPMYSTFSEEFSGRNIQLRKSCAVFGCGASLSTTIVSLPTGTPSLLVW